MLKMKPITDNTTYKEKDYFSCVKNLVGQIANKSLQELESDGLFIFPESLKDAEDIDEDQMVLKSVNGGYRSGNVMGFIGYGDERLVIGSRFDNEGKDYFFYYLMAKALRHPNIIDLESDVSQEMSLFNLFYFLFPHYLKAAMRKGLYKEYVRRKYNDMNVKGAIDVARHIQKNTPFMGNIAYNTREFSFDNSLTELVRHTIEFIKNKPCGSRILGQAKDEVRLAIEATPRYKLHDRQKIIAQNKKNPVRHAYFREYLDLQRLCLWILKDQKHKIADGARQIYGVLFDGAWLWEEYVNTLIGGKKGKFHHPRNKKGEGAQQLFKGSKGNVGLIYPDFISKSSKPRIIADAKYKRLAKNDNSDYFQLLAYMYRFDAKTGYLLYPEAEGSSDQTLRLNRGTTFDKVEPREGDDVVKVIKRGLKIPADAQGYADFAAKMKDAEAEFKKPPLPQ